MKKLLMTLLVFGASLAYAAHGGEAEAGEVEVPKVVLYQAINVVILFGALVYFLRGAIVKFYADRRNTYLAAEAKSKAAQEEARHELLEITHKLEQLNDTLDESYSRARAEAADMKHQLIKDAQEIALRLKRDAEATAKIEIHKAQVHLREQLLKDAIEAAKTVLSKDIGSTDHQKLQSDFVNKVQAVNP